MPHNIHRIGGSSVDNLRLKKREQMLQPPGISVLMADEADQALSEIRGALPNVRWVHASSMPVASTSIELIRATGFDIIHVPSANLPNHYRIIHPLGSAGFSDSNLERLSLAFIERELEEA